MARSAAEVWFQLAAVPAQIAAPIPMLTGRANENTAYGAVVTRMLGFRGNMPPYVHVGSRLGVGGGRLGAPYFPLEIADPTGNRLDLPQFSLSANLSADRLHQRSALLSSIDQARAGCSASASARSTVLFEGS